jgi:hypothetical protein
VRLLDQKPLRSARSPNANVRAVCGQAVAAYIALVLTPVIHSCTLGREPTRLGFRPSVALPPAPRAVRCMVGTVLARHASQVELVPTTLFNAVGRPLLRVVEGGFGVKPLLMSLGYSADTANHVLAGTLARTLAQVRNPSCWTPPWRDTAHLVGANESGAVLGSYDCAACSNPRQLLLCAHLYHRRCALRLCRLQVTIHPIDTIKCRLQVRVGYARSKS